MSIDEIGFPEPLPPPTPTQRAAALGREVIKRGAAKRLAELMSRDKELAERAIELGLIDRRWIDDPTHNPISKTAPAEVLQRFLEGSAERRPSLLPALGLSALQLLSTVQDRGTSVLEMRDSVAVMFTDLEGFTAYTSSHGDLAALELLDNHRMVVGPIVRRHGGRVVKHLGDGMMLAFEDAGEAIGAGIDLIASAPEPLRLRAGIHVGPAMEQGDDLLGHVVNVSARVCEMAAGGELIVTSEALAEYDPSDGVIFDSGLNAHIKGVDGPMIVHRILTTDSQPQEVLPIKVGIPKEDRALELIQHLKDRVQGGGAVTMADLDEIQACLPSRSLDLSH